MVLLDGSIVEPGTCIRCEYDSRWALAWLSARYQVMCGCRLCSDCNGVDDDHYDDCPHSPDYKPPVDRYELECDRADHLYAERKDDRR